MTRAIVIQLPPEDYSHLQPTVNIEDCIIDLAKSTLADREVLHQVLLYNHQVYTDESFSDIWNHWNPYITGYCCNWSGTWNITGIQHNISLHDFIHIYSIGPADL